MFQIISVFFLRVKAFVFYFPPPPSGFHQCSHIFLINGKVRQKQEPCLYVFCLPFPASLFYQHIPLLPVFCNVYLMTVIINVRNEIMPACSVNEFLFPAVFLCQSRCISKSCLTTGNFSGQNSQNCWRRWALYKIFRSVSIQYSLLH